VEKMLSIEYKCNLIIPGFAKSGTSSLHSYLAQHPKIVMSENKEPHYFSVDKVWLRGTNFHNALFSDGRKKNVLYYGESSTTYSCSTKAMERIKTELDSPKIILLVRDPIKRTESHYRWLCSLGLENRSFFDAIMCDGFNYDPNKSFDGNYKSYLEFSSYSKYIPQWQEAFGKSNVLILFTDELEKHADIVLDRCWCFLGLSSLDKIAETRNNQTGILVKPRPIAIRINKLVPKLLREYLKSYSQLLSIWRRVAHFEEEVYIPKIDASECFNVTEILDKEAFYYKKLKLEYGLLGL